MVMIYLAQIQMVIFHLKVMMVVQQQALKGDMSEGGELGIGTTSPQRQLHTNG